MNQQFLLHQHCRQLLLLPKKNKIQINSNGNCFILEGFGIQITEMFGSCIITDSSDDCGTTLFSPKGIGSSELSVFIIIENIFYLFYTESK